MIVAIANESSGSHDSSLLRSSLLFTPLALTLSSSQRNWLEPSRFVIVFRLRDIDSKVGNDMISIGPRSKAN